MKRGIALTLTAAALWLLGSVWYYDCKIKRVCGPESSVLLASTLPLPATKPLATDPAEATILPPSGKLSSSLGLSRLTTSPPVEKPTPTVSLTVRFDQKSAELMPPADAEQSLYELGNAVAEGRHLAVTGHSDSRGERARIQIVSQQRAEALRRWLIAKGIPAEGISIVESHEDREPVADNTTAEGRAQNRRAVATILSEP